MKRIIFVLFVTFVIFLVPGISGYEINTFNDSSTYLNISSIDNETMINYSFISIFKNITDITGATFNISGFQSIFSNQNVTDTLCSGSFNASQPCSNSYDNDWGTYTETENINIGISVIENYTLINTDSNITWKGYIHCGFSTDKVELRCRNWTSGSWVTLDKINVSDYDSVVTTKYNISIPSDCINASNDYSQLVTGGCTCSYPGTCDIRYYETNITSLETPKNISVDTINDSFIDWNYTDKLNTTTSPQEVDLNITSIEDYLSSCTPSGENCTIPIKTSFEFGNIEISDLFLYYNITEVSECDFENENKTLDIYLRNEESDDLLVGNLSLTFFGDLGNYSFNLTGQNNYSFCYNFTTGFDADIIYDSNGYSERNYFLEDYTFGNTTYVENITLYLLNSSLSEQIIFNVKDIFGNYENDVVIKLLRYYMGSNTYKTVSMARSGFDGKSATYLKPDTWYRIILQRDGVVLNSYDPRIITENEIDVYTEFEETIDYFNYYDTIAYSCSMNNATNITTCTVTDTSGHMTTAFLKVKTLEGNPTTICDVNGTGNSVVLTCNVTGYSEKEIMHVLYVKFSSTPSVLILSSFIWSFISPTNVFGLTGVFLTFLICVTCAFMGLWKPEVSILLLMVGLFSSVFLRLFVVDFLSMTSLLGVSALILYRVLRSDKR